MGFLEFKGEDLAKLRKKHHASAVVKCRLLRPTAGGVPASPKGLAAFVQHHLKLEPGTDEFDDALARLVDEEIGERDDTPDAGELKEKKIYAVNVIRRSEHGPFLLEHMVKACFKVSASRLGFFVSKKGSKGDVSEMGMVLAHGVSLKDEERPWEIYLVDDEGNAVPTEYHEITGTVSTASGRKSISHHTEVAPEGSIFEFEFRWLDKKLKPKDVAEIIAFMGTARIGSVRSTEYGGFEVLEARITDSEAGSKKKAAA